MTSLQAKKFINLACRVWKIRKIKFLLRIVNFLRKNIDSKRSLFNDFEFSLKEDEPKIRLLHLDFWNPDLSPRIIRRIIKKRGRTIISIFKYVSQEFNCHYNRSLVNYFFQFNQKTGLWPIQFGLEYQNGPPIIKVYLSLAEKYLERKESFSLRIFCKQFNLNYPILKKVFQNKEFDTVAIDFLPHKQYLFKFYLATQRKYSCLYRVSPYLEINSIKIWQRYPEGLFLQNIYKKISMPLFLKDFIHTNKCKIYYFCREGNKSSFYFR